MGYPDTGSGMYAKKLAYKDWFEFNCRQRVHCNNLEHMSWTMPLLLISGVFLQKSTIFLASTTLIGRELYRWGYYKEGPTSKIREVGAVSHNAASVLMMLGLGFVFIRHKTGSFLSNRKIVKRFTHTLYDKKLEGVKKEIEDSTKSWAIARRLRPVLPLHPRVMGTEAADIRDNIYKDMPAELRKKMNEDDKKSKVKDNQPKIPDIANY